MLSSEERLFSDHLDYYVSWKYIISSMFDSWFKCVINHIDIEYENWKNDELLKSQVEFVPPELLAYCIWIPYTISSK